MDRAAAEAWIRQHVEPAGDIETTHDRPWATVMRVPVAGGVTWFKACAQGQAFEPSLTAELYARWPDRVTEVLAVDEARRWLLLGDAGIAVGERGNPPEAWLDALPSYAELQRGETAYVLDHLGHGVPDLRMAALPAGYQRLMASELPLARDDVTRLRDHAPRFTELCLALAELGIQESVQHDDLHMAHLYSDCGKLRIVDWGDSSIAHPFFSLVVTFRFLEEVNHLTPDGPVVPQAARRLPGAVGERTGTDVRNRDPRRLVCAFDRMDSAAGCAPARGATEFRQSVRDHLAAGDR